MNIGWVKIHRKLLDHPRFTEEGWLRVWMALILSANHSNDGQRRLFAGKEIVLKPGQLITSRDSLARTTDLHPSHVERILKTLRNEHQIEQQADNRSRLITITSWKDYQKSEQQSDQQDPNKNASFRKMPKIEQQSEQLTSALSPMFSESTRDVPSKTEQQIGQPSNNSRTAIEQQPNTHKNVRNEENYENGENGGSLFAPASSRNSFTPPTLEECEFYAREINLIESEAAAFFDWFTSNGWKVSGKTPMKDWRAALRTWQRRQSNKLSLGVARQIQTSTPDHSKGF